MCTSQGTEGVPHKSPLRHSCGHKGEWRPAPQQQWEQRHEGPSAAPTRATRTNVSRSGMRLAGSPASTFNSQPSKPKVTARRASWATASSTRSSMFSISAAPAWARAEQAGRDRVKEHQGFLDGTVATGATSKSVCVCVGGGLSCTQRRESRVTMKSGEGGGGRKERRQTG
jgi:hypothetical protein